MIRAQLKDPCSAAERIAFNSDSFKSRTLRVYFGTLISTRTRIATESAMTGLCHETAAAPRPETIDPPETDAAVDGSGTVRKRPATMTDNPNFPIDVTVLSSRPVGAFGEGLSVPVHASLHPMCDLIQFSLLPVSLKTYSLIEFSQIGVGEFAAQAGFEDTLLERRHVLSLRKVSGQIPSNASRVRTKRLGGHYRRGIPEGQSLEVGGSASWVGAGVRSRGAGEVPSCWRAFASDGGAPSRATPQVGAARAAAPRRALNPP